MGIETLLLELYNADLCIHEIALSQETHLFTFHFNQRFECLRACLQATKSWIDVFRSIPPTRYVGLSICTYAQLSRTFIILWRLSTCEYPEWDRSLVRETLDVPSILDEAQETFAQVRMAADLDRDVSQDADFFSIMAARLRSVKFLWDAMSASMADPFDPSSRDDLIDIPTELLN